MAPGATTTSASRLCAAAALLLAASMATEPAGAEIPPCELDPGCKTESSCEKFDGPNTENEFVFDNICLNNVKWAEPAFWGQYDKHFESGVYKCSCCGQELYSSEHKYNSYSGWPAFYDTITPDAVLLNPEDGELVCSRCGAHLGHRFSDGPKDKTGLRDCINSVCLHFHEDEAVPANDKDTTLPPLQGSGTGVSYGEISLGDGESNLTPRSVGSATAGSP